MSGKKLSFGARFGLAAASFVLGILLFVSAVVTMLVADVRVITSENNIRQLTKLLLGSPQRVHSVVSIHRGAVGVPYAAGPYLEEDGGATNSAVTEGLVGFLYEGLKDFMGEDMTMTQEELEAVVEQSTMKDFISDKAAGLVTDYIMGEVTTTIDGEEIKQLLEENKELIEQVTGQPLPEEMVEQIVQVVETNEVVQKLETEGLAGFIEELGGALPEGGETPDGALGGLLKPKDPNALGNQMAEIFDNEGLAGTIANISSTLTGGQLEGIGSISDVLTLLRSVTSVGVLLGGIGICLVLIAAIILINIKQLGKGLRRSGHPLMWAGSPFLMNLVVLLVPSLFDPKTLAFLPGTVTGFLPLVRHVLLMTIVVNGVAFCLGLVLVIAGFVLSAIAKKNAAKAASQPVLAPVGAPAEAVEAEGEEISEEIAGEAGAEEVEEPEAPEASEESETPEESQEPEAVEAAEEAEEE